MFWGGPFLTNLETELKWELSVLGKNRGQYIALVEKFRAFVIARADAQRMQATQLHDQFVKFESAIEKIADTKDIWNLKELEEETEFVCFCSTALHNSPC